MDDNTLEFIIKMRDEATDKLKSLTGELATHVDAQTGLAQATGAAGAGLNGVADAAIVAGAAHGSAADATTDHADALKNVGEEAEGATPKVNNLWQAFLMATTGSTEFAAAAKFAEDAMTGVGQKSEEATVAMKVARAGFVSLGESARDFSAEAGIAGEILGAFGAESLLITAAVGAVSIALSEGIKQFAEYQEMASRTTTFDNVAGRAGGFEAMHQTSLDLADNSTFSSTQLDEAGAAVSRFTNLSSAEVSQVMQLSADAAAATGQNIESVAAQLGRAFNEPLKGAMLLNRYTRNIDPSTMAQLKQMDAAGNVSGERSLLASKVEEVFGGQAEEQTKTLAGAFSILGDGLEESFGKGLTMVGALIDAFTPLQAVVEGTGRLLEKVGDGFDAVTQGVLTMTGANGPEAQAAAELNNLLNRDSASGSMGSSDAAFYRQADAAKIASLEAQLKTLDPTGGISSSGQFVPSGAVPIGNRSATTGLYPGQDSLVGTAYDEANKLLPEATKNDNLSNSSKGLANAISILEGANQSLEALGPPAKEASATIASNTTEIGLFKTALAVLGTQITDTTSAVDVMVSKLANQASLAGLIGGAKDVQTTATDLAGAYLKDHPEFAGLSSEKGRNSQQLLQDASQLPSIQADAIQHQNDMVTAQLSATATQNAAINPYYAATRSKDPETAALAKAITDGIKEAFTSGGASGEAGLIINPKTGAASLRPGAGPLASDALKGYDSSFTQSLYTGQIDASSAAPSAADKKFTDITDVTDSATAYNNLLKAGNVTLGQAKEYQEAYTEAQQASADKSISFQAALKETTALIQARNAATAESTQLETDHTNAEDAAVNAAMLAGGPLAAARLTAQNKASDAGLTPGSAAYNASVASDLTANTNAANKTAGSSITDLQNQLALLSAPQNPNAQADAKFAQDNPGVSSDILTQYDALTAKVNAESAAVQKAQAEHAAWTSTATRGFESVDSALVNVIMRTQTWGQAFGDVAKQMASQIANLVIQQELLTPLESMMGLGGAGGGKGGGVASGLAGAGGLLGGLSGLFGGGSGAESTAASVVGAHQGVGSVAAGALSGVGGSIMSGLSSAGSWLSSFFADGGVSGAGVHGSIPLKMYAAGGVANSPQMSVFGEAGPEAYVPLADGRSIPVTVAHTGGAGVPQGGSSAPVTNHINVTVHTGSAPSGATPQQHAAMVGAEVSRQLEGLMVKTIQQQQRSGGILS